MSLRFLLIAVIASATLSFVESGTIGHDKVQPFPQPEPVTESEKAAVKFKPSLIIQDGCHPYPAVNAAGETSGGLKGTGKFDGHCKGSALGSQVYGRAVWHNDLWAIMYAWYFPKDMWSRGFSKKGHRHNWVSAVVWLDNPAVAKPKILAVSASTADGKFYIEKNVPPVCRRNTCDVPFADYFNGTTPMLAYRIMNKAFSSVSTITEGLGEFQNLVMWEQLTEEARDALSETDFGEKVKVPFVDANFNANLEASHPSL